jgi:hypothetical protein
VITFDPYAKVRLDELTDDLGFEFLDLPTQALTHYLLRSAVTMCREGDLVLQTAGVETTPGVPNYLLEPADDTELVALVQVRNITPGRRGEILRSTGPPGECLRSESASWFVPPDELFIVAPYEGVYEATFSVSPARDACEIPAVLRDRWYEILLDGARHYLHVSSGKPWSDKKLAFELGTRFQQGIRRAKTETLTGFQRGVMRMGRPRVL